MKKKLLMVVLTTAVAVLTACGQAKTGEVVEESTSTETAEVVEESTSTEAVEVPGLKVGMLGKDIKTACVILSKEMGYFEEEGVNVEFEQVSSLPEGITAVSMGDLDILPYGAIPSCSFISQGTDVVIFGGTISEGSECIVLPEHADDYQAAEDFAGKKIGCFRMETGHMVMKGFLREAGLDVDKDVEFIYLDSQASIMEAVQKGEVDLGFVNSGYGFVCEKSGLAVAFQVGDFVNDFPCCRQTTSRDALNNKKESLVRFETALLRAYALYINDHEAVIEKLTDYSGQDADYVEAIMYGTEDYDPAMIISLDPNKNKVMDFYEVMRANGDIDANTPVDIADYIDTDVYETALQNLLDRGENTEIYEQLMTDYKINNN